MMVNVLEHVLNAPSILRILFNMLKPGGKLIFNDRWDDYGMPGTALPLLDLNVLYHPIRMKKPVFEQAREMRKSTRDQMRGESM